MIATNSPAFDLEADVAQRMHVDIADMIGPRDVLEFDDRFSHDRTVFLSSEPQTRPIACGASRLVPLRCSLRMTGSSAFTITLQDLGKSIVVETGHDWNPNWLVVFQYPDGSWCAFAVHSRPSSWLALMKVLQSNRRRAGKTAAPGSGTRSTSRL